MSTNAMWNAIVEVLRTKLAPLGVKTVDIVRGQIMQKDLRNFDRPAPAVLVTMFEAKDCKVLGGGARVIEPVTFVAYIMSSNQLRGSVKVPAVQVCAEIQDKVVLIVAAERWNGKAFSAARDIGWDNQVTPPTTEAGLAMMMTHWTQDVELSSADDASTLPPFRGIDTDYVAPGTETVLAQDQIALEQEST